jgi:hypothetical protein
MQKLEESILTAKWKSYKSFKPSGEVRLHNASLFREFDFALDRTLTIKEFKASRTEKVVKTTDWVLEFHNKKHYLKLPSQKISLEIITVNHTVMVIMDNTSQEKIFLVKEPLWKNYLTTNEGAIL